MTDFPKMSAEAFRLYRRLLPYGQWTLETGKLVLFNRDYEPIRIKASDGRSVRTCDPHWVEGIVAEEHFYEDATAPTVTGRTHAKIAIILREWDRLLPRVDVITGRTIPPSGQ